MPNIVIEGFENMTEQQIQEKLVQELSRLQVHNNMAPNGVPSQHQGRMPQDQLLLSSEEQPPAQPAGSREHSAQQARLSMAKMGTHSAEQTI